MVITKYQHDEGGNMSSMYDEILEQAILAAEMAVEIAYNKAGRVDSYPCGFSSVVIGDARAPFVRYMKKKIAEGGFEVDSVGNMFPTRSNANRADVLKFGTKNYDKGWRFSNPGQYQGQNLDVKMAGSEAFAGVLNQHGIACSVHNRLD